jgi:glutamyl-Q tRNA(Asp) synthetase
VRIEPGTIAFQDRIQGSFRQDMTEEVGDFVIRRADGIHAYQLAVVVDDAEQQVNQVVRGADLIASTPRQIFLQRALGLSTPRYAHLPLAVDRDGRKLSKSHAAAPVEPTDPLPTLVQAWAFLGQTDFPERPANLAEFKGHALATWDPERVPTLRTRSIPPRSG